MAQGRPHKARLDVQATCELAEDGSRVVKAIIKGEKKLLDSTILLEERGGVAPLASRIESAIKKEVVQSLRDMDEFFKLMRAKAARPRRRRQQEALVTRTEKALPKAPA